MSLFCSKSQGNSSIRLTFCSTKEAATAAYLATKKSTIPPLYRDPISDLSFSHSQRKQKSAWAKGKLPKKLSWDDAAAVGKFKSERL